MSKEAMKLALEALELAHPRFGAATAKHHKAIAALREALAEQPAQQHDYWQEEARRYAQNADFWRGKYEAATAQQQEPVACKAHCQIYENGDGGLCGGECKRAGFVGRVAHLHELNDAWLSELPVGTKLYTAPQPAIQERMPLSLAQIELCIEWFNSVQDLNPDYLGAKDHTLAKMLYERVGRRVPSSISVAPAAQPQDDRPEGAEPTLPRPRIPFIAYKLEGDIDLRIHYIDGKVVPISEIGDFVDGKWVPKGWV